MCLFKRIYKETTGLNLKCVKCAFREMCKKEDK